MVRYFIYVTVTIFIFVHPSIGDIIVLSSGERIDVTITENGDAGIKVRHEILGEFTIERKHIASIEVSQPQETNTSTTPEETDSDASIDKDRWNQNIRVGLGFQEGQKSSSDLTASYHADRTKKEHEISFDASYRFSESENERTLNRFASAWGNKWFQSDSRWDIFTTLQFDWAEFQSWDQRLLGDFGVGIEIYTNTEGQQKFILTTRLGSGFRKEFNSVNDDFIPEGLLGLGFDWVISPKQKLVADSTWYPDYEDVSNYRLVTDASWNLQLNAKNDLTFSIGFHHEYNSVVDPGIKHSDLQLTAGIIYSF